MSHRMINDSDYDDNKYEEKQISDNTIRIAVLGATGAGKSSLCNLLCGNCEEFEVNDGFDSCTQETKSVTFNYSINNRELKFEVIDCPGFFDTNIVLTKINKVEAFAKDIAKCIHLTSNGISAFLLLVPFGRLNGDYANSIKFMRDYFSKSASKHVVFVFTKARGKSEEIIVNIMQRNENKNKAATELVLDYLKSINNKCMSSECIATPNELDRQRDKILNKIYKIHNMNDGLFYGNVMWKAFKKQKRKYQQMKNRYYAAAITGTVGIVSTLLLGLKYMDLGDKYDNAQRESQTYQDKYINEQRTSNMFKDTLTEVVQQVKHHSSISQKSLIIYLRSLKLCFIGIK